MTEDLYDWDDFERRAAPVAPRRGRGGAPAAVLAAALWAIDDVVLGERSRTPVIEEMPVPGVDPGARVVVHLVPGDPQASYALVRW
ncbi:MAG TPA: hypothetical protein VM262_12550 [Acidimicrobiales bacterium]|nr:hypothetical protein [Acidimicrobiales bacterium]